eukprot:CAMPEP_0181435588 /NCGR_PEP_ID=MMETSP1110-20121109/20410_1 /TAXON_ID=174948 /ORGANISM="Symbiodinium sp., Strain CCMP421" /LENGTH=53 /DNA_ID=CAMNT_0023559127 /DNA_START=317 /DNA_END=478 /DNA_ORIENTATION=+
MPASAQPGASSLGSAPAPPRSPSVTGPASGWPTAPSGAGSPIGRAGTASPPLL